MKRQAAICSVVVCTTIFCAAGCSDSTRPDDEGPGVVLSVLTETVSEDGEEYVVAVLKVENRRQTKIYTRPMCGFLVRLVVEDSSGRTLNILDPNLYSDCPGTDVGVMVSESERGERRGLRWAWDEAGLRYRISEGTYNLHASFLFYFEGRPSELQILEKELVAGLD